MGMFLSECVDTAEPLHNGIFVSYLDSGTSI